jgi:cytochrome c
LAHYVLDRSLLTQRLAISGPGYAFSRLASFSMRRHRFLPVIMIAAILSRALALGASAAEPTEPAAPIDYRSEIWPIIKAKCLECHNAKKRQGGLDISTRAAMLKGGDSGAAFVPGNVEKSLMLELIEFDEMPPRKEKKPAVTKAELKRLSDWIAAGGIVADEP